MNLEKQIIDKIKKILPKKSEKTVFYIGITKTSNEVYFYSYIDGKAVQCYALAEQYKLDENELADVFSEIVSIIKGTNLYNPDKYNVGTILIDKSNINFNMDYYDMNESEYRIQKNWKKQNVVDNF